MNGQEVISGPMRKGKGVVLRLCIYVCVYISVGRCGEIGLILFKGGHAESFISKQILTVDPRKAFLHECNHRRTYRAVVRSFFCDSVGATGSRITLGVDRSKDQCGRGRGSGCEMI